MDEMMLEVQVWLNKTYNVGVVEDRNTGQWTACRDNAGRNWY